MASEHGETGRPHARRRIIQTCLPCHRAKRKCNRKKPCSQCLRRHTTGSCVYEAIAASDLELLESGDTDLAAENAALRSRLHDLEAAANDFREQLRQTRNLLAQEQRKAASSPAQSSSTGHKDEQGVYYGRSYYLGGPAAPDLLQQMMSLLPDNQTDMLFAFSGSSNNLQPMLKDAPYLFPTFPAACGVEHMLAILDDIGRARADSLLDSYYELVDPLHHYVPTPWLMQRYERCWDRETLPQAQEAALVFAVLALGDLVSDNERSSFLLSASMQLLRISNMLAVPTLDTLHSFCYIAVYMQHQGKLSEYWPLLGLVIRLAQSLALHRDPSAIPLLPPEEWEIRRRLFWIIAAQETALSLMFGRPYGIGFADCQMPQNVRDDEVFNPSSAVPREPTTYTEISYHRLTWELGEMTREIMDDAFRQRGPADVNRLKLTESRIRHWHESVPAEFKFTPSTSRDLQECSSLENRKRSVQAVLLHTIVNHNILVLFRKSLLANGDWEVRRPCYEAAFSIADGWKALQDNFPKMARVAFLHWFRAFHGALICFIAIRMEGRDSVYRDKALASWISCLRIFRRVQHQNPSISACWRALSRLDVVMKKEMAGEQRSWRRSIPKDVKDSSYNLLIGPSSSQPDDHSHSMSPPHQLPPLPENPLPGDFIVPPAPNDAHEPALNPAAVGLDGGIELFYDNYNANIFDLDIQNWPTWLTDSNSPQYSAQSGADPSTAK
ncbi:hypothetical protein CNMCM5793_003524 [Aspergillus hiratsukae]|uniref:Zn(2)-C6 fungal-type domain-containing protein n=1 Tax=Aspergillus hiratsukae TaxID=1194566 RepID=A0A8H6PEN2_9EURO|nr:hypothetical protein CNMCM5793_003524 [Aspergillus hiratsukae]KAF7171370.1 hypothetical protein CNMCM6106_005784 [Aspergillus hiratsukae]